MSQTRRKGNRARMSERGSRVLLIAAGAAAVSIAAFLDKRRRHIARDQAAATVRRGVAQTVRKADYASGVAKGAVHGAAGTLRRDERDYDDVTLARKVETELFRPADAPKGSVSVNVVHGVVELRGEVRRPEDIKRLAETAAGVDGVKDVHNLLHTSGSPPKHSPPSEPDDVRSRADEPSAPSRFSNNPATSPPADEPLVQRAGKPDRPTG